MTMLMVLVVSWVGLDIVGNRVVNTASSKTIAIPVSQLCRAGRGRTRLEADAQTADKTTNRRKRCSDNNFMFLRPVFLKLEPKNVLCECENES